MALTFRQVAGEGPSESIDSLFKVQPTLSAIDESLSAFRLLTNFKKPTFLLSY